MPPPPRRSDVARALSATSRLHHLIEWLRSGRPLTTTLAAEALGVSRRTIARDLARLRDAFCLAIHFDGMRGTYALAEPHAALPFMPHPDLVPMFVNGRFPGASGAERSPDAAHLRFSARSVQAYEAASGLDLSHAVDAEGRLNVFFDPPNRNDLVRWILSSGAEVEVVAPHDLQCRVVVEIRRMLELYEDETVPAA